MTAFREKGAILDHVILVPSSGGAFEVTVNETKIYSKLDTGTFPEIENVIEKMESLRD